MVIFHSYVRLPEGNHPIKSHSTTIFLWFSYGDLLISGFPQDQWCLALQDMSRENAWDAGDIAEGKAHIRRRSCTAADLVNHICVWVKI